MTRHARWSRSVRLAVLTGTACLLAASCGGGETASGPGAVVVTDSSGAEVIVSEIADGPLVANLWATWCPPCVAEMPAFDEVAGDPDVAGVTIVGINVGDDAADATSFAAELGVTYPQFTDPDGLLSTALSVSALPATAFFAADGTLVSVHSGAFTADELRAAIRDAFEA